MALTRRKRRFLQLLERYLEADSVSGEITRSGRGKLARILRRVDEATNVAKEEVQLENEKENWAKTTKSHFAHDIPFTQGLSSQFFSGNFTSTGTSHVR
jgi:hypothetical protein